MTGNARKILCSALSAMLVISLTPALSPSAAYAEDQSSEDFTEGDSSAADSTESDPAPASKPKPKTDRKHAKKKKVTRKALIKSLDKAKGSSSISGFGGIKFKKGSKAGKRLKKALASVRKTTSTCSFAIIDLKTGKGISSSANKKVYGASTIKGPYVTAVCKYRADSIDGSAKSHISAVAAWSSNDDYKALRGRFGSTPMRKFLRYCGVNEISASKTWVTYSAKTLGKLWVGSYWANFKNKNKNSAYLRGKYRCGARSFIKNALGGKAKTYTKTGWGPFSSYGAVYNDAGIVVKNGHPYVVVVMSKALYHSSRLKSLVKAIDKYHDYLVRQESK